MYLSINQGAIFVADSHLNEKNSEFLTFLKKVQNKEITTTQLFLMGDMFDFISVESRYFTKMYQESIDIINELSNSIEIIYLEGNHDYNLKSIFPKVKLFSRENQPINAKYKDKTVSLSHGDIYTPFAYNLYCKVIRSHFLLLFLNGIDFNFWLSKKIYKALLEKKICNKMSSFDEFAMKRISNYNSDIIIEGHYHQGKSYETQKKLYINIPSLCCDKKYFVFDGKSKDLDLCQTLHSI